MHRRSHFEYFFKIKDNFSILTTLVLGLVEIAENLSETAWDSLVRPPKYIVKTEPRKKPVNVKGSLKEFVGHWPSKPHVTYCYEIGCASYKALSF